MMFSPKFLYHTEPVFAIFFSVRRPDEGDDPETHTVSYDEKPGIQAIATTSPDLPPREGNGVTYRDYEYVRRGTLSLLAGLDLVTGEAIPLVRETHKSSDFIEFLKLLDSKYPKSDKIRLILDNHSAHTSKEDTGRPAPEDTDLNVDEFLLIRDQLLKQKQWSGKEKQSP